MQQAFSIENFSYLISGNNEASREFGLIILRLAVKDLFTKRHKQESFRICPRMVKIFLQVLPWMDATSCQWPIVVRIVQHVRD
jgi:hypothetical protein